MTTGEVNVSTAAAVAQREPEPEVYSDRWEQAWGAGLKRGERWDGGGPSPALVKLLESQRVDFKGKRVLVPGCGRGYDIPAFAAAGAAAVVGLELAPSAAREAGEYVRQAMAGGAAGVPQGGEAGGADVRVEEGDFFAWRDAAGDGSWDIGFDYTFGCAMHPSMRMDWAQHWARAVAPGGTLLALVFPVNPDADPAVGPPFPVTPQLYEQLLAPHGFELQWAEPVAAELSHPGRGGKEVMTLWRRR